MRSHWVFASPGRHHIGKVWDTTPIMGVHTRLPILAYGTAPGATPPPPLTTVPATSTPATAPRWLLVQLPGRPNGHTGWIQAADVRIAPMPYHVVVSTFRRQVRVYRQGHLVRTFAAIVGKPSTPTPRGEFFVEERVPLGRNVPGAPDALALSARSNVLQEFEGGPGQIAIHGIDNIGGTLGTGESHGCIRVSTAAIHWLAGHIVGGTPVTIT